MAARADDEHAPTWTASQALILEAIRACPRHFEPQHILQVLRQRRVRMSRATVYRTLEVLIQAGLVKRHCLGQNTYIYELLETRAHHDHMVCLRCGHMIEFYSPEIERLQDRICMDHAFTPQTHTMLLFGYCQTCRVETTPP